MQLFEYARTFASAFRKYGYPLGSFGAPRPRLERLVGFRRSVSRAACTALTAATGLAPPAGRDLGLARTSVSGSLEPFGAVGEGGKALLQRLPDQILTGEISFDDGRIQILAALARVRKITAAK